MTQPTSNRCSKAGQQKIPLALQGFYSFFLLLFSINAVAAPPSRLISQFPFTLLTGGIIIVEGRLDHYPDTLNFVLDTGSGGISLDSTTVANLQLPVTPSNRTIKGIAGVRKVSFVMNRSLLLPKLLVDSLNFHINDYSLLTSVYGMKIDGIIGYSFFSRYIVKINYDTHELEVWEQGDMRYPKAGITLRPVVSNIPVFPASITDEKQKKSRFFFDTGGGLCVLLSEKFVADSNLLKKGKKITITQAEGVGGKKPMKITTVKEVQVGQYKFRKVPTYIFDDEYNITAYPYLAGLIGNDLLRRFNLIVNYQKGEIHMLPNGHFAEPFDYSYIGLGIYMVDGKIVVEDVIEGSPGQKAGFLPGDIVIAVGNNLSNNIQAYKSILQTTGARVKVLVSRNGAPMMLTIKVESILSK